MDTLTLETSENTGVLIVHIVGYVSMENVGKIHDAVEEFLGRGGRGIVLDFRECNVINSPGTAAIMNLAMRVTEDFQGNLVVLVLDPVKISVFELAGIFLSARKAGTLEDAVTQARAS